MLSPDVPEFIPRGIHTSAANIGSDSLKNVTCIPARDLVYPRQNPNYVLNVPQQHPRSQPNHTHDGYGNWRQASTNASPRERGEAFGRPKLHRYGNAVRHNSVEEFNPEASSDYPSHRASNWRQSWWSNDSSPDKSTKSMSRNKKYNNFSAENQPETNQQKHNIRKGRGGSQGRQSNDHSTENNLRLMMQVEKHSIHVPLTTSYKGNISYGKVLKGSSNVLQESKSETRSGVGLLQDDQWPSLGDTRSEVIPQIKRDFHLSNSPNQSNNLSLKKSDILVKTNLTENAWHVKVISNTAQKNIEDKVLEREVCKNVLLDTHSSKNQDIKGFNEFSDSKAVHHNQNEPNSKIKNEWRFSAEANILPEKTEYDTGRKDALDSSANPDDYNIGNDLNPKAGTTDPFQWQVKGERKKPTKNKDSHDQADRLTMPVKKIVHKDDSKRGNGSKPCNTGPSVRKRILKEESEKYKNKNVKDSSHINKFSTNKIYKRKENNESKETVTNLYEAARQVTHEKTGNKENRGQVLKDGCGAVASASRHCDANKIAISTENAKDSILQDQKKPLDEHTMQKILELRKRRKEEKMRKKEQKLKKARDLMTSDSKVRVITKDFLEATLAGNNSNKRSAKLSVSHSPDLKLSSEEYPTLSFKSAITPRTVSDKGSHKISTAERMTRIDALSESEHSSSSVKVDSRILTQPSGVLQVVNSEQNDCTSPADTPSYSGALLAPKRVANLKVPSQEVGEKDVSEVSYTALQKKKVKTKDLIELDIMAAALQSKKNKRRDKLRTEQEAARRANASKSTSSDKHIGSPSKNVRGTTAPSHTTKVKVAAPLKRGKQREGKQKKKISCLKKCMKRARQAEMEALLSILQEAKKAQERSAFPDKQEIRPPLSSLVDLEVTVAGTASSCLETNKELRRMAAALDIASAGAAPTNELKGDKVGTENVSKTIDEEKHNDLRNTGMSSDSSSNEESDKKRASVVIGACERYQDILDGRSEAETQGVIKKNDEVIGGKELALAGKEKSDPTHIERLVNMAGSSITAKIINNLELEKDNTRQEKIEAKEMMPAVQNILGICSDPERSKTLSIFAEELRALQNPIHKKKFREYCDHVITADVDRVTQELVESLVRFQERHYQRDPSKARIRRRFVCGLKETTKLMGKMSCIIVAPDIQRSKGPGALDEVVEKMLGQARSHGVPVIFALSCKRLGKLCLKKVPVSCFGIINYQGAQDSFQVLMQLVPEARKQYQELVACGNRCVPVDDEDSGKEAEPAKLDIRDEVIAKTSAIISVTDE
ncbi:uncharacterized protein Sbp2 [Procambarus clarkii]|uniref:uncharacterized protein Sbp2 n=1 Tax=Procambarus clarkii TaxID=6728 RepID=UPI003742A03C